MCGSFTNCPSVAHCQGSRRSIQTANLASWLSLTRHCFITTLFGSPLISLWTTEAASLPISQCLKGQNLLWMFFLLLWLVPHVLIFLQDSTQNNWGRDLRCLLVESAELLEIFWKSCAFWLVRRLLPLVHKGNDDLFHEHLLWEVGQGWVTWIHCTGLDPL